MKGNELMSTGTISEQSKTTDPQVLVRRTRKLQQKAMHGAKNPDGQVARTARAKATLNSLKSKLKKRSGLFHIALTETLDAYAKAKCKNGDTTIPIKSAFALLDQRYANTLSASELRIIRNAIKVELAVH